VTEATSTSTLDIVTLIVAIAGISLALASLGWQAATFFLSGGRAKVRALPGGIGQDELGRLVRLSWPENAPAQSVQLMRAQGFVRDVVIAEVRNVGRLALSVDGVLAETDDGFAFTVLADPENPALPHRLEAGAKESWHVPLAPVQALADSDGKSRRVRMKVELGSGKVLRTKLIATVRPSR
jgi:hypothetical protein